MTTPPDTADDVREMMRKLSEGDVYLPCFGSDTVRVIKLLEREQCGVRGFRELVKVVTGCVGVAEGVVGAEVVRICRGETGWEGSTERLVEVCNIIEEVVGGVIEQEGDGIDLVHVEGEECVPETFWSKNENGWVGRVKATEGVVRSAYERVAAGKRGLVEAVEGTTGEVVYDVFNNLVVVKKGGKGEELFHPRDR